MLIQRGSVMIQISLVSVGFVVGLPIECLVTKTSHFTTRASCQNVPRRSSNECGGQHTRTRDDMSHPSIGPVQLTTSTDRLHGVYFGHRSLLYSCGSVRSWSPSWYSYHLERGSVRGFIILLTPVIHSSDQCVQNRLVDGSTHDTPTFIHCLPARQQWIMTHKRDQKLRKLVQDSDVGVWIVYQVENTIFLANFTAFLCSLEHNPNNRVYFSVKATKWTNPEYCFLTLRLWKCGTNGHRGAACAIAGELSWDAVRPKVWKIVNAID